MDYEKKYKEVLERARKCWGEYNELVGAYENKGLCEEIFPELKESEDERIRGAIIYHLKDNNLTEWAAWLEKQGEQKPKANCLLSWSEADEKMFQSIEGIVKDYWAKAEQEKNEIKIREASNVSYFLKTIQKSPLCWIKCSDGLPNRDGTYLVVTDGRHNDVYDMARYDSIEGWHKASEIIYWMPIPQLNNKSIIEQNHTDKVEQKFKVGDWVIFNNHHESIYQIEKIENYRYFLRHYLGGTMSVHFDNELIRLWTIQDAKDGDVVVDKSDGAIGIFQSIGHHPDGGSYNDPSYCFLHCRYDDGFFYADFEDGNTMDSDDVIPATKEQRDLLFQKMREAGYEWNAEKKELKKVEQNPAWSEEDVEMIDRLIRHCKKEYEELCNDRYGHQEIVSDLKSSCRERWDWLEKQGEQKPADFSDLRTWKYIVDAVRSEIEGIGQYLDSQFTEKVAKKLQKRFGHIEQQKQEWSEEDTEMIDRLIRHCKKEYEELCNDKYGHQEIVSDLKSSCRERWDWLESLKDRVPLYKEVIKK